jgi:hypothetical protein
LNVITKKVKKDKAFLQPMQRDYENGLAVEYYLNGMALYLSPPPSSSLFGYIIAKAGKRTQELH